MNGKWILVGLMLWVMAASAEEQKREPLVVTAAEFEAQRQDVLRQMRPDGKYGEISEQEKKQVLGAMERISSALTAAGSTAALTEEKRIQVHNDQELINTLLTKAKADSRVVCERVATVGSHFKANNCATVAERRMRREFDQEQWRRMPRKPVPRLESPTRR